MNGFIHRVHLDQCHLAVLPVFKNNENVVCGNTKEATANTNNETIRHRPVKDSLRRHKDLVRPSAMGERGGGQLRFDLWG